jgi:hypothetical protein
MSSNDLGGHYPVEINTLFSKAFQLLEPSMTKVSSFSDVDADTEQALLSVIELCRDFETIYQNWINGENPCETLGLLRTLLLKIEDN